MLKITTSLFAFLFSLHAFGFGFHKPYEMPVDLTFEETLRLQQRMSFEKNFAEEQTPEIRLSIKSGERLNKWIKKINENREDKVRLSNPENRTSTPIDRPKKYGPKTIKADLQKLLDEVPEPMKRVVFNGSAITSELPMAKKDFEFWGRKVSRNYQSAVRWTMLQPWLKELKKRKARDVRGYYHLLREENLDNKLDNFSSLDRDTRVRLFGYLVGICINHYGPKESYCQKKIQDAIRSKKLKDHKNTYMRSARAKWNSFFRIANPRSDVRWSKQRPSIMDVVFLNPFNRKIANWLKVNIEDEFKLESIGWRLRFNFLDRKESRQTAYIEFKPNVTPHVSQGNIIVMDANVPIEEYDVRWTIRHEYGHILRLPDCYVEFFEESQNLMVNYQLDVTDLMCSRAGDMNERIYKELKRVYLK